MQREEVIQKAIEIALKNGYQLSTDMVRDDAEECVVDDFVDATDHGMIYPINDIIFNRGFREALVGNDFVFPYANEFVFPCANDFSTTNYVKSETIPQIEMSIADYHLIRIASSNDRIGYLENLLLYLENK